MATAARHCDCQRGRRYGAPCYMSPHGIFPPVPTFAKIWETRLVYTLSLRLNVIVGVTMQSRFPESVIPQQRARSLDIQES